MDQGLESRLEAIEDPLRTQGWETFAVINLQGDEIHRKSGSESDITIDEWEERLMQGAIVTHNHPKEDAFQTEDLKTACRANVHQFRVVSRRWTYTLDKPDHGWPDPETIIQIALDAGEEIHREVDAGRLNLDPDAPRFWHEVCLRVAARAGITYRRIAFDPASSHEPRKA